jgi:GNAT superfamily N-acetyltransferase
MGMEQTVEIREAAPEDLEVLVRFNRAMARETEGKDLPEEVLRAGVRAGLGDPALARYFVAVAGERVVGSLMLTTEWSDWRNGTFWWIQSVFVDPEWRRRGVYRALHEGVRARARAAEGVCGIRLYVERENRSARAVYRAMGMEETSYRLCEEEITSP